MTIERGEHVVRTCRKLMPESTSNRGCTHTTVVLNLSKGVSSLLEESGEAKSYTDWTVASELLLGMWEGCYVGSVIMHYQHPLHRYGYPSGVKY
jgi:hypothetical protein